MFSVLLFALSIAFLADAVPARSSRAASQCACTTTNVNVRNGAGVQNGKIGLLYKGECLPLKSVSRVKAGSHTWWNVLFKGKSGWIAGKYLMESSDCVSKPSGGLTVGPIEGCPRIVSRAEWGARPAKPGIGRLSTPVKYMFIHHTTGRSCYTQETCSEMVKGFQKFHQDTRGWSDIGYSYLVGEDGNVYEGRGADEVGAHTRGYNSVGLAISFIGDFTDKTPSTTALNVAKRMIDCLVQNEKLEKQYVLRGHRDMGQTACPGTKLYNLIRTWPHY